MDACFENMRAPGAPRQRRPFASVNRTFTIFTVRSAIDRIGGRLPQGWGDLFRQLGLFALADLAYDLVRGVADGKHAIAFAHGQEIINFERSTHTFFEPHLQSAILPIHFLVDAANAIYMNSQFAITISFLVCLYLFRNEYFYFVRNMFIVSMVLALVGYALYPTAPPRLFPQYGFVDTLTDFSGVNHDSALVKVFVNPYAAMPSMHCAFALMVGGMGIVAARHRLTKALWALWPLLVMVAVVVTANHYWIDVAAGALVAVASALIAVQLAKARPEAWAFRTAASEARA
jgi:membrane-associated phospholipid phosphatase